MKKTLVTLAALSLLAPAAFGEGLLVTNSEAYDVAVDTTNTAHLMFGKTNDPEGTYIANIKSGHENRIWAINHSGADGYPTGSRPTVGTAILNFEDGSKLSYSNDANIVATTTIIRAEESATASLTSSIGIISPNATIEAQAGAFFTLSAPNVNNHVTSLTLSVGDGATLAFSGGMDAKKGAETELHISLGTDSTLTFGGRASLGVDNTSYAKSLTLEFGAGSKISAANQTISFGDTMQNAGSSISITAQLSDAEMEQVMNATYGTIIERTLITCSSIDHLVDCGGLVTGSVAQLSALGMQSVGIVTDASRIAANQYGFVKNGGTLKLYINTPEPATATLSLLALAGLAARRRRH